MEITSGVSIIDTNEYLKLLELKNNLLKENGTIIFKVESNSSLSFTTLKEIYFLNTDETFEEIRLINVSLKNEVNSLKNEVEALKNEINTLKANHLKNTNQINKSFFSKLNFFK